MIAIDDSTFILLKEGLNEIVKELENHSSLLITSDPQQSKLLGSFAHRIKNNLLILKPVSQSTRES